MTPGCEPTPDALNVLISSPSGPESGPNPAPPSFSRPFPALFPVPRAPISRAERLKMRQKQLGNNIIRV